MKNYLVVVLTICSAALHGQIFPSLGGSRTGTAGMQFLKIAPDALSASIGGAGTVCGRNASSLAWNPAMFTDETEGYGGSINSTRWIAGTRFDQVSAFTSYKSHTIWGVTFANMNYGVVDETTEFQPFGTGRTFRPSGQVAGICYSRVLTNQFSFGVNTKWAHEGYAGININNFIFDLGLMYRIDLYGIRFSVVMQNFGVNRNPTGQVVALKYNGQETINHFQPVSVPAVFRMGACMDAYQKGNHKLTLYSQLNHFSDNNETMSLGSEYTFRKYISARMGYEFGTDAGLAFSTGLGIRLPRKWGWASVDYSWSYISYSSPVHRISCNIGFKKKKNV